MEVVLDILEDGEDLAEPGRVINFPVILGGKIDTGTVSCCATLAPKGFHKRKPTLENKLGMHTSMLFLM